MLIIEFTFMDNGFAEIDNDNIKFWQNDGLPDYDGSIEGFYTIYPYKVKELISKKVIKAK